MPDLTHNRVLKYLEEEAEEAQRKGDFALAESLYKQLVRLQEAALGADHVEVAFMLHNVAIALEGQDKREDAESIRDRAAGILEKNQKT